MRGNPDRIVAAVAEAVGGLLRPGGTVLLACSGGADSVALASAVSKVRQVRCAIGHVDHGLRPDSAAEAQRVEALAARLGVPFHQERLEGLEVRGPGLEAAAREGRYAALERLAKRARARAVATAHTRRDQAETLLLRVIRGAGPGALAGIRRERQLGAEVRLVRPLLGVSRQDTEAYCAREGLAFSMDPHNADPARLRARLRALWPSLLALNPRLEEALAGTAELLADEDDLLAAVAQDELRAARTPPGDGLVFPPLHRAILRRALHAAALEVGARPERRHIEELRRLLRSGGVSDLPGARAMVRHGVLSFRRAGERSAAPGLPEVAIGGPGSYRWGPRTLRVGGRATEDGVVDPALAPFPWTLRGHRAGDRFRPRGGRTKKVSDLWIDARVPRELRPRLAVLADAEGRLFWVEGLRPSDACDPRANGSVSFAFEGEMDSPDGTLSPRRRGDSPSATMTSAADEEPR